MPNGILDYFVKGTRTHQRREEAVTQSAEQAVSTDKLRAQLSAMKAGMDAATVYGGMETPEGKAAFQTTLSALGYKDMADRYAGITANTEARNLAMQQEQAKLQESQAATKQRQTQTKVAETLLPGQVQQQQAEVAGTEAATAARQFGTQRGGQLLPGELEEQKAGITAAGALTKQREAGVQMEMERLPGQLRQQEAETEWMGERGETVKASLAARMLQQGWQPEEMADFFKTYLEPKQGIGQYFDPRQQATQQIVEQGKARQPAFSTPGASYVDTGDGQSKLPQSYKDIGIQDPDTAEQFQAMEKMIGKSLPEGFDLRKDFATQPEFYRKLLKAIKEGVADPKNPGQKRKLSTQEIIDLIQG